MIYWIKVLLLLIWIYDFRYWWSRFSTWRSYSNCRKNKSLSCELTCVYDIIFTNLTNNKEVILTISLGYVEFKLDYWRLKKIEKFKKQWFYN